MQFVHTDDQLLVRETARAFLGGNVTAERLRRMMAAPLAYDESLWREMAGDMGWAGIAIAESHGGAGLGWVELCLLMEEQGRTLLPSPFFPTVALAAPLIDALGTPSQKGEWLRAIAQDACRWAVAIGGEKGLAGPDGVDVTITCTREGAFRISGSADYVVHAMGADRLLVLAREPGSRGHAGLCAVVVLPDAAGVRIEPRVMLDLTRPAAKVIFDDVPVAHDAMLGDPGKAGPGIERALDMARIALASEALGGVERAFEKSIEYVMARTQFGRTIGSFQAIKHRVADLAVQLEAARSAAWYAACIAAEGGDELGEASAIAKSACCDAYLAVTTDTIQLHGGIGYTWDHDAHLYFKRARATAMLLGSPAWQRARLAGILGLGEAFEPSF